MTGSRRVPALRPGIALGLLAAALSDAPAVAIPLSAAQSRSAPALPPRYQLRGGDGLARAYEFILEGRFDQVEAELRRACGPAPAEACHVLDATALWWRIQLDPESRALDAAFNASVERAIRTTEAWSERAGDEAEAWFYLGGAYGARVQWRVLRGEKVAAARDGKRIKQALERAVALEPGLEDAYFGLGMYKYYADVAPAAARVLRFLLLLPGGDRDEGLRQMLRARSRGQLLQGEADYQLHLIYLWYERQTGRALELLQGLQARYPGNPIYLIQIAGIEDSYAHDLIASLESWRALIAAARDQRANQAAIAETQARLGAARMLEALSLTDEALEHLQLVVARKPQAPYSALALAYLRLGEAHDRLGARAAAMSAYRAAIAAVPPRDPYDVGSQATARLGRRPDARAADAFRLSLDGWRLLERGDLPGATGALERSIALAPDDAVARYRYGRILQARREDAAALTQFEHTIGNARGAPPPILADAHLEAARLHERLGRGDEARAAYTSAATLFGAAASTRAAAARALARLSGR